MKEKYGDVFLVHLGVVPVVVVSGLETVKKVLLKQGEQFADRPKLYTLSLLNDGTSLSFTENYGEPWKLHKKIAKMCLREFSKSARSASSPSLFEQYVSEEANLLVETLLQHSSKKGYYNPIDHITYAVANVVCALCFGKRYDHDDDDEFLGVIQISEEAQNSAASAAPADFIPILRYFPLPGLKALLKAVDRFNNFSKKQIKEHYDSFDKNHIRDITDALLLDCSKRKLKDKHSVLTDAQVLSTVIDVFGAGFDTTSSALQWSLFYLLKFPELQEKIHKEIGTKIGFSRMPRFEDRKKCISWKHLFMRFSGIPRFHHLPFHTGPLSSVTVWVVFARELDPGNPNV
ncbi:cytochrome P450 1A1-like [Spea bombifrons]|uniref:cytochrome P450 1A1-like n=1 Tax=Spea bombifrons TaxID=233779 RepID=UPI0023496AAA|nr:cytochrome P450 1A1-like [Spea bombifrons]